MKPLVGPPVKNLKRTLPASSRHGATPGLVLPRHRDGGGGREEVDVKVTKVSHTFKKDDLYFNRNGRIQSSTEDDWVRRKRDQRTVLWIYRHGKTIVGWTKELG
jgi:hypothetical protein